MFVFSFVPISLMALAMYYSKATKEEMSCWIGTGTVEKTEFVRNTSQYTSLWKATFLIHDVIKEDENRNVNEFITFYYRGAYYDKSGRIAGFIACPPDPSVTVGDKAKLYLLKDAEMGIPDEYYLLDRLFFMKVEHFDNLSDTLPGEEERIIYDVNPLLNPNILRSFLLIGGRLFF